MCSYVLGNRYGLRGGIIAVVISEGVRSFFAFLTILQIFKRESMRFNFKWSKENFKILTNFSFPAYLSGILVMPVTWWSYSQVASKMNGNAQMGLFSAADQWRAVILFVPHAIGIIALPMLSEAVGRLNKRGFVQTVRMNLFSVIFSSVMISIGIILGRNIILSFYGNDYLQAGDVILFLTFAAIIQSINAILGQVIAGLGKMWFGVLLNFSWAVAFVVGLSKLFPQVAFGLAQTYLLAYLVQLLLSIMIVIFLLKYEWV
jgi:O-antigen/teichoic acid export membrane protein